MLWKTGEKPSNAQEMELHSFITLTDLEECISKSTQSTLVEASPLYFFGFFVPQKCMELPDLSGGFAKSPVCGDGGCETIPKGLICCQHWQPSPGLRIVLCFIASVTCEQATNLTSSDNRKRGNRFYFPI